jgi:hypothetical protein
MMYIKTGQKRSDAIRKLDVMVDDDDYEFLSQFSWQVDKHNSVNFHNKNGSTLMHRIIMKAKPHQEIDHIDGNRLNNQKSNLRFATSSQNKINRGSRCDCKSGYKGVSWHNQRNKWTARIMVNKKYLSLGLHDDLLDAVKAYNDYAKKYFGEFAWLNKI